MSADFTGAYIECLNTISQQAKRIAELEAERDNYQRQFQDMHSAYYEAKARQIPDGWVAVPIEMPQAMVNEARWYDLPSSAEDMFDLELVSDDTVREYYRKFLAAAPKPGGGE